MSTVSPEYYNPDTFRKALYIPSINGLSTTFVIVEGNLDPEITPLVYVHGGPGDTFSRTSNPLNYIDLKEQRIILIDQIGCGQSRPQYNDTDRNGVRFTPNGTAITQNIEHVLHSMGIEKASLYGVSNGSALSLGLAVRKNIEVEKLVLSGLTLGEKETADGKYGSDGLLARKFPALFANFTAYVGADGSDGADTLRRYQEIIESPHKSQEQKQNAAAFFGFVAMQSSYVNNLTPDFDMTLNESELPAVYDFASSIMPNPMAYAKQAIDNQLEGVFEAGYLANNLHTIDAPTYIVQGRNDLSTPADKVFAIAKELGGDVHLALIDAGHDRTHPAYKEPLEYALAA